MKASGMHSQNTNLFSSTPAITAFTSNSVTCNKPVSTLIHCADHHRIKQKKI